METQQITTLEQVPAGLTRLLKEVAELRNILEDSTANQTPTTTPDGELLTRQQVADRLKVSLPTLNELTKNGKIKAYRIGNRVRYKDAEVNQVLTQYRHSSVTTTIGYQSNFVHKDADDALESVINF